MRRRIGCAPFFYFMKTDMIMRKIYLLLFLLVPSILAAQSKREIHLSAPGTLPEHITDAEKYTIEELTVSGNVNGTDMRLLRDMAGNNWQGQLTEGKLQWLDLSEANIVAGGEKYVDTDKIYYDKQGTWKDNISFNTTDNVFPPYAFMGCNSLKVISLPKTVTEIGHCAFALGMLTSVTIPNGVRIIGKQAFYDCAHLAEFPMPESLTSLGIYALAYCTGLTKVTLPAGLTEIVSIRGTGF